MEKYGLLKNEELDVIIASSNSDIESSEYAASASAGAAAIGCAVAAAFAA